MSIIRDIQKSDNEVNAKILSCLDIRNPKSFIMLAGAGSGKTRTLVEVLESLESEYGEELYRDGRKIAVITYTNAACNEIISRLHNIDLFSVSTIHSFAWSLISNFQKDIKVYVKNELEEDIIDLEDKQSRAKSTTTKTYMDRKLKIKNKSSKLDQIQTIRKFTYSPDSENNSLNSLNHSQVIKIFAHFLENVTMQKIFVRKFPILLVDECQDTNKNIVDSFIQLNEQQNGKIAIGFFGDMMQRIYSDGKADLNTSLDGWEKFEKKMNYRCPKRIVKTLNKLREDVDGLNQYPVESSEEGSARVFLCDVKTDRKMIEKLICEEMSKITCDENWKTSYHSLILEHQMAAERLGFGDFYSLLHSSGKYKNRLTDGTLIEAKFFEDQILQLVEAYQNNNHYLVAKIAKKYFIQFNDDVENLTIMQIKYANETVEELIQLWSDNRKLTGLEILRLVSQRNALVIPDSLRRVLELRNYVDPNEEADESEEDDSDYSIMEEVMRLDVKQIKKYNEYMRNEAGYITHQGVKGLEFPRVMLIINDNEANGFLFSYEKLFNIKERSKVDLTNERDGKETSIDRTKRLFYVGCSRAEESLAIVIHTDNLAVAREKIISSDLFSESEIITIA